MAEGGNWWTTANPKLGAVVLTVFLLICVSASMSSDDPDEAPEKVRLHGSITVYDQRTCADGPMIRVSAGARGPLPLEYNAGNAPCQLIVDTEIEAATQYKFEVRPLAPVIRMADQIRQDDGSLKIDLTLYS